MKTLKKSQYELIAEGVRRALEKHKNSPQYFGVKDTALSIAIDLEAADPKFDRQKFLEACGVKQDSFQQTQHLVIDDFTGKT